MCFTVRQRPKVTLTSHQIGQPIRYRLERDNTASTGTDFLRKKSFSREIRFAEIHLAENTVNRCPRRYPSRLTFKWRINSTENFSWIIIYLTVCLIVFQFRNQDKVLSSHNYSIVTDLTAVGTRVRKTDSLHVPILFRNYFLKRFPNPCQNIGWLRFLFFDGDRQLFSLISAL